MINLLFDGREGNMAGYCTLVLYFIVGSPLYACKDQQEL